MSTKTTGSRFVIIFIASLMVLLVAGISVLGGGTSEPETGAREAALQTSRPAFTLMTRRILVGADGRERLLSTQQRVQRSEGILKLIHTDYKADGTPGRVQTMFVYLGLGVFQLDESRRRLVFVAPHQEEVPDNLDQFLREHPLFVREESVGGVNTIVWRSGKMGAEEFSEEYRAPSLGGAVIKRVKVSSRGREAVEPTAIEIGEPAPNLFAELMSYGVDYADFERRVLETESRKSAEVAGFMREALARMRTYRP